MTERFMTDDFILFSSTYVRNLCILIYDCEIDIETPLAEGGRGGGSPCRLSILRNANVARLFRLSMAMLHVECKK